MNRWLGLALLVGLVGAVIYLGATAVVMFWLVGQGDGDLLMRHGEPYLVVGLGVLTGIAATREAVRLNREFERR
ncbi:MAG: hypothetical protein KGI71_04515 [Patescibacteria group bacterium]|nr:hypothetical protein [Patescibacteria group bacterium]